jgi:IS5 family transposase
VAGGFTGDDFSIDEAAGVATCPAGITRLISRTRVVTFGAACRGCPLRARCTAADRGRHLQLHPHEALLRAHRARAADPGFQATYRRHRPMVERSIAWISRGHRRVPYRGIVKNDAWLHLRVAAINLRRLLTLGLIHTGDTWILTPA